MKDLPTTDELDPGVNPSVHTSEEHALSLSVPPPLFHHLRILTTYGIFGRSPEEVAERLICRQIETMQREGLIKFEGSE